MLYTGLTELRSYHQLGKMTLSSSIERWLKENYIKVIRNVKNNVAAHDWFLLTCRSRPTCKKGCASAVRSRASYNQYSMILAPDWKCGLVSVTKIAWGLSSIKIVACLSSRLKYIPCSKIVQLNAYRKNWHLMICLIILQFCACYTSPHATWDKRILR